MPNKTKLLIWKHRREPIMQSIKNKISTCQQDKTLIKLASTVDMLFRPFSNHLSEKIIAALEVAESSSEEKGPKKSQLKTKEKTL